MGFRAGLKNAGKWQRVKNLLEDKPQFNEAVDQNPAIHAILSQMDTILIDEAVKAGVADQFTDRLATNGLMVPLRVWQGRLVYSSRAGLSGAAKKRPTANQKAFRLKAKELRDHVDTMIRAYSALDDAWDMDPEHGPNPGGALGDGDGD